MRGREGGLRGYGVEVAGLRVRGGGCGVEAAGGSCGWKVLAGVCGFEGAEPRVRVEAMGFEGAGSRVQTVGSRVRG